MSVFRRRALPTPRLVVGLVVLGAACHRQPTVKSAPPPAASPSPSTKGPAAAPPATTTAINSASSLVRSMRDRYAATYYRNVAFVQKTIVTLTSGGEFVQTWNVAGDLPGRWRIDTDPASKAGLLYLGDSLYQFAAGKLAKADTGTNELLLLAFDVYAQSPTRSEATLRRLGFDVARFHESTWHAVPIYVIGAARGDTTSKQIWIERDRLLPLRLLENSRQGRSDFRFGGYDRTTGGWVATEIELFVNGKRRSLQQLTQVRTNTSMPDALFDPRRWAVAPRWTP